MPWDIEWEKYWNQFMGWLIENGPKILFVLILMWICIAVARSITRRAFDRYARGRDPEFKKRTDTLSSVVIGVIGIAVVATGVVIILGLMDIKIGPILAAAGIVGVAVGFGAQHLVRDVINGFFILLDDQIRVGDVVQIAGHGGLVERINLRMTVLRDLAGSVHYVRNGEISTVTNMTKDYSRYVFKIGVAYREDVDEVIRVVQDLHEKMRAEPEWKDDILEPLEVLGLDEFGDSAIIIKARTKTKPIRQWAVGREFNRRMKRRFDELNIEIPFPHITLYPGQEKDGSAPPLHIAGTDNTTADRQTG